MKKNAPVTEEKVREIVREENQKLKDDIFVRLDDIAGQLETIRQEQTIGFHQYKELEEKVDDHEKRLVTLESPHS